MEGVKMAGTLKTEKRVEQRAFKCAGKEEVKRKWHEKKMHGQFVREILETVVKEKSWRSWLAQGDLKVSTEAFLCAAQVLYR